MSRKLINCHIKVSGRVQGVGFRYFTKKIADELNIRGWVKNCPDGTVELEAEAGDQLLDDFLRFVKRGPSLSRVTDLNVAKREVDDFKYSSFQITY